jgi:hypothetical protein
MNELVFIRRNTPKQGKMPAVNRPVFLLEPAKLYRFNTGKMQHIFQTPVSLAISVPRNTVYVTKHTLQTLFSCPSTLDGRLQGCSSSPTDCPAAADMLRFLPQESPGPAPRKPLLRARFLPHASRQRFAGNASLRRTQSLGESTPARPGWHQRRKRARPWQANRQPRRPKKNR